jgi:acetyl-CoA synthetase (ADP-forming)
MVIVASGGVLVELLKDVVTLPAPVSARDARAALERLRIAPLLAGYRGKPALDVDAATDVVVRFGAIATRMGERDFEIEVNPLALTPEGCVALDARARFA